MRVVGSILFFLVGLGAMGQRVSVVEQSVPATAVVGVGGFAGNRIAKNQANYIKTFAIEKYVGMIEARDFTAWDWKQGEQPGKWLEAAIITATRTHDAALEAKARSMYQLVLRSQGADGYVGITSAAVRTSEKPLRGMDAYELFFAACFADRL
jgi:hypothetical protein